MANLDRARVQDFVASFPALMQVPVKANSILYEGAMVSLLDADGMAVRSGTASTGIVQGIAKYTVDATGKSDGDLSIDIVCGLFYRENSVGNACAASHVGKIIYVEDDQTVANTGTYEAGICLGVDSDLGVLVFLGPATMYATVVAKVATLASTLINQGASLIGVHDSAGYFTATNVETVLAEIIADLAAITAANGAHMIGFEDGGAHTTAATVDTALDELLAKRIQHRLLVVGHADLTAAAATETLDIGAVLPANATILGVTCHTFTPFTGGMLSAMDVDIGSSGDVDAIRDGIDAFTAAVDGAPATQTAGVNPNKTFVAAGTQLAALFTATGGDVADATAGALTIDVIFTVLS